MRFAYGGECLPAWLRPDGGISSALVAAYSVVLKQMRQQRGFQYDLVRRNLRYSVLLKQLCWNPCNSQIVGRLSVENLSGVRVDMARCERHVGLSHESEDRFLWNNPSQLNVVLFASSLLVGLPEVQNHKAGPVRREAVRGRILREALKTSLDLPYPL